MRRPSSGISKGHRKEEETGLKNKKEKTKSRRRKTLHYGRFKFTACNKQSWHRAVSCPRPIGKCPVFELSVSRR